MAKVFETTDDLRAKLNAAVDETIRLKALVDNLNGNANWSRARAMLNASDWWRKTGSAIRPQQDEAREEFAERVFKLGLSAALKGL